MGSESGKPELSSWRDSATRQAIESFVASVTAGPNAAPEAERIAVFDNDGTLWSEKPMLTQLHYAVEQWRAAAAAMPELVRRQPYLAATTDDLGWFGRAIDKHYDGDDSDLKVILDAVVGISDHMTVAEYQRSVQDFYRSAQHPILKRPYAQTVYQPMTELIRFLEHNEFTCYIVSGGERDFMRPMTQDNYGIPPERVIGSAYGLSYDEDAAAIRYSASLALFDDGPQKPIRIWSRIGRRPLFAAGNSNGDMQMMDFTIRGPRPGFAVLIHHDDDTDRGDAPYDSGAEKALAAATERGYAVVSIRDDWDTVFPDAAR